MAKVKTNFASLTDAQNAAPAATESANTKSTGFNFSSLADSDVATPEVQPSKKKVDTGLSGTTSFLDSSFKAKGPLFDSKEELTRLGKIEGALTPEERAQRAEDARQQKIAEDKLANYKRSVIYDAVSNAAELGGISKPFFAGIVDAGAGMVGLAGLLSNFRPSGLSTAEYVNRKLEEERAGVQPTETASLQEERYGKKASTNIAYEAAAEMSGLSGALTKETEKGLGISEEDLAKGPVDLIIEGKLGSGLKVLAVEVVKSIPNVIIQSALAPEAGVGFLAQKAATFATTTATSLGSNIAQDYAQDKDISSDDILKGIAKSAIEGLTESFFMGDIKAVKGIGASLVKGETTAAKEILKGVIEKEGKEAAKQEIARGFSKPLAKMLGKGFEGASVVGQFNKGGVEEGIEEVMSTVGSFIVDRVADGNWSDADYNQLVKDASNAFVLGYGSGGLMNGVAAQLSMKKLTDEQKAKVEKFNEVANNEELSAEVRKIAKDKANDIIRESADQSYAGYDELTRLPVEKRVQAFSLLSDINAQEESKKNVKDVDMIAAIDKSIEAKKADYDYLLTGVKPSTQPVVEKAPATEEEKQTTAKIQTEEQAYQEELAKADKSWKETIGMPSEPMKVSSQFSVRANPEELGVNNSYEPSPNMPIEVDKKADGKKVQFTTKENPDALLEGDVYTINQGNKKFATILSANRNGVQEYYVPELPDAKPFANLDDAKFAVQEKLTGVRVKEIERSGIDRLRADKFIPKADIVVRTDNGQEVLLDPVAKKSIQNAVKAFKSVSNAPVYLYRNTEDFKKGVAKELGSESKALESAGQVGGGFFTNARNEDSIHINLANISSTTIAHELFHGTVVNVARQNPSAFAEMRDAIINKLGENDLINVSDENGKLVKLSAREYLDRYSKQYSPEQQAEEFLSELTGLLATDMAKLKDPTIWETIKLAIRNLVKTANIDIPVFEKTANINDTVKFFTDLSKSLKTGQEIKLEKLKIQNDKEAVKQGTAVQATNGESQIAEEDESLRDSVSKTVTQRRKGNELGKKKRKLSAVAAKAMAIEPTTPDDYALQYFINGGQVIRGSKDDTTEKDTVFSLFSKSRMGGAKESVSEMRARVRIMAGRDAGGLSISEIAEKTFAEYQQATKGDVGIDVDTQYDFMDFKNAVESAILGHKSDTAMANTLLESKNKPAEEGAIALTEEQELEALRIKAEAQALGLTEEEFMAKLAELQDTPEMQAAEEAYAQALDMIDDEDFAKLYELNDDDIAKIDELMAGVESTEGVLDDKLAEQKKIVRDLEAERKKVLAAIEKASKEKQLDIEGKAPIQEQLFATDTKSLTDRLQSIETQLTAAKADVAATQSAIDFQERGTVDMFEQEVKPEPKKPSGRPLSEETTERLKINRFGGNEQLEAWTEELELLDEKISKLEKAGKGRGIKSLDWFKEQAEKYRGLVERKKIELAEIEAELAAREDKSAKPAVEPISESKLIASVKKASKAKQVRIENFGDSFLMLLIFDEGERQIVNNANEARINDTIESLERKVSGLKNRDLVQAQQDLVELAKDSSNPASRLSAKKRQINSINEQIKDIEQIELPFAKYVSSNIQKQPAPALETVKPAKPAGETKVESEIKFLQAEIGAYEREIENSLEEIENTKSNYREAVAEIKEKKAALAKEKLSRDERDERKEELDAELEDAADERDTYIEQYQDTIAEAKSELKKLNKRLAKLQEAKPAAKFQKQGISVAPKSVGAIYNKYPNVVLDVFVSDSKKEISLDRIIVPKEDRNKGVGTDIVNDLTRYADANGYRINLTPSGDFGGSKDRLTKFYKGFGFVENKGKNKDFSTKELMYRLPLEKPNEEEINAEFSSTRDNTPIGFNYDTDLVARERFNIPALKRIGEGSDRVVFDLGDGNVLKVAKTARGLAQNIYEGSYDLVEEGILPEVLETGLNYIVAEKVEPAKGNKAVNALMRELKKFYQTDFNRRNPELQDVLEANDLGYVMNYDILYGDFSSVRNWGVKNGKPIHLDGGTFGGIQMLQQYRDVKNLNDNDFREVYYKSRQAKEEFGDTDKFTKFQKQGIAVVKELENTNKFISDNFDLPSIVGDDNKVVVKYQSMALRHGSPYNFDKFTLNKVGAGEGQQVYGYGLYFSEDPEIAKAYSRANQGNKLKNLGILDKVPETKRNELYKMMQKSATTINDVRRWLDQNKGFFGLSIPTNVRQQVEKAFGERAIYTVIVDSQDWRNFKWLDWGKKLTNADIYVLGAKAKSIVPEMNRALISLVNNQKGTNPSIVQKQYNEASSIINMAEMIGDAARSGRFSNMTGQEFYQTIQKSLNSQKNTSELLYMFGYDGVRVPTYFMLSGGMDTGKSNYVVFNDKNIKIAGKQVSKFQKQGISVAPAYKYQMNEMFKDPQRLTKDIESKYDIRTVLRERGQVEEKLLDAERAITDNIVLGALSRVGVTGFKTIGAIENAPLFKAGTGKTVKLKEALTGWAGYTGNGLRSSTLKAIQSNNKFAAETGRVAASLIGNLAKSDILQEQRKLRTGAQLDANNSIAMLAKGLNGMIGFDERALMRVHSLLDPEAFIENEDSVTSPSELSLQELRLYNTLRDMNDFIHEWHYQNGFLDDATYEKYKGKYFARMYEEIEKREFADLSDAIDKMPSGADFRMFKERKDFSEIELTLMNDPIYITSRRLATMLHNKATIEFCNAMAADPSYVKYSKLEDVPENNRKGFRLLESAGGGKRYGDLSNKYIPIALYEELRGTTFATKFMSKSYDVLRMYDGLEIRQFLKKTKTLYNPTTRLGNITTNFAFAWLAGVDPFTMMKNRVKAKDSLDNYDSWAKELAMAGALGTNVVTADLAQRKKGEENPIMDFLVSKGLKKELVEKAKTLDKYLMDSYGRTDDVAKISLYRSLVEDYGKSKEEAIRIVGESMQNYATVGKAYQFFSKLPLVGNPFVKFSSDMARIVANGFANRPLYMASFLGMMYGVARLLSSLSGEPEDEREARESRAFIPKIPLGFTDIPLTWKVGKYEVNAARFISPYYVYDAGYRSNTIAELTKFAPIQLSYDNKVGFASDYMPVLSDPFIAPLAQVAFDKDFRGLPIADPNGSKYTKQTVSTGEALWNRFNYLGHSYASPAWGYVANLYSAAKGEGDLYGRRRDIPSAILNSVIKVQEMESKDVQKAVINQVKYIDSEYKQIKTDITSRRNDDVEKIQEIIGSDATESQKEEQIMNVKANYSNFVEEMVGRMQELKVDREVPMDRLYKLQHPKKND